MGLRPAVFIVSGLMALPAAAQEIVQVTSSTLYARSAPDSDASILGTAYSGRKYVRVGTSGEWRKIWFGNTTAWVDGAHVASSSGTKATVTASALNVRAGAGSGYAVVGTAPNGSWWVIIDSSGSRRKIHCAGAERWVYGAYLAANGGSAISPPNADGLPSSSAGFVQLPSSGPGFYGYYSSDRRWGVPSPVCNFMAAAKAWQEEHPEYPRIGVGDISLKYGGPISGHASTGTARTWTFAR